jgi:hypothetical protein
VGDHVYFYREPSQFHAKYQGQGVLFAGLEGHVYGGSCTARVPVATSKQFDGHDMVVFGRVGQRASMNGPALHNRPALQTKFYNKLRAAF